MLFVMDCAKLYIEESLLEYIISKINYNLGNTLFVNKLFNKIVKKKILLQINILQKWWKLYRLPNCVPNPDLLTRNTLLRYYIAKYELQWIKTFPRNAIHKLGIIAINFEDIKYYHDSTSNAVTTMRNFCNKYMNKSDFIYYGW